MRKCLEFDDDRLANKVADSVKNTTGFRIDESVEVENDRGTVCIVGDKNIIKDMLAEVVDNLRAYGGNRRVVRAVHSELESI